MTIGSPRLSGRQWWLGFLLLAACGGAGHEAVTQVQRDARQPIEPLADHPQVGLLHLRAGHWSAHFAITALSPPEHTYEVKIVAPARANVAVRIHTWYGVDLGIEDSTIKDKASCVLKGKRSVCDLLFPQLEAQRAGSWTVIATDRSRSAATVRIAVTFSRACGRSNLPPC